MTGVRQVGQAFFRSIHGRAQSLHMTLAQRHARSTRQIGTTGLTAIHMHTEHVRVAAMSGSSPFRATSSLFGAERRLSYVLRTPVWSSVKDMPASLIMSLNMSKSPCTISSFIRAQRGQNNPPTRTIKERAERAIEGKIGHKSNCGKMLDVSMQCSFLPLFPAQQLSDRYPL